MDSEEAERYLMGIRAEAEAAQWEEHLLVCAGCRERISETGAYLAMMCAAAEEIRTHPEESDWRLSDLCGGVAAFAGMLVLGLLALRYYPPPLPVRLTDHGAASAPAGRGLDLRLDRPAERLEIQDASGQTAWQGELPAAGDRATLPAQHRGLYMVRVLSRSGELQREYRLEVR